MSLCADLVPVPYSEAVSRLWGESWAWNKPVPKSVESRQVRLPHQRVCRLEARFLEGCKNLMSLQGDSNKSWRGEGDCKQASI